MINGCSYTQAAVQTGCHSPIDWRIREVSERQDSERRKSSFRNIEGITVSNDDAIVQWMLFIDGKSKEVMEMLAAKNKDIGNAFDLLKIISNDKKARIAYEAREAELMDQRTRIKSAFMKGEVLGIKKGRDEGKAEGKAEIILALLARGMGVEEVASIAGMDINGVIEIQKGSSSKG